MSLSSWQKTPEECQFRCAVMRHAQRADTAWPPDPWVSSLDATMWPRDPPLTQQGLLDAMHASAMIVDDGSGAPDSRPTTPLSRPPKCAAAPWVVVSSPYLRCLQTAVQVCTALQPAVQVTLMVDNELGEVYGPEVMGETEPVNTVRPYEVIQEYCEARRVPLRRSAVGRWPKWPENLMQARTRFLRRFLKYLDRSSVARRNFVLVTHADGVAAALAAMPTTDGRVVEQVDYCGMFVAEASAPAARQSPSSSSKPPRETSKEGRREARLSDSESPSKRSGTKDSISSHGSETGPDAMNGKLNVPIGWKVTLSSVRLGHRFTHSLAARLRGLARRTGYSETEVARLLRCLPGQTLTDEPTSPVTPGSANQPFTPAEDRMLDRSLGNSLYFSEEATRGDDFTPGRGSDSPLMMTATLSRSERWARFSPDASDNTPRLGRSVHRAATSASMSRWQAELPFRRAASSSSTALLSALSPRAHGSQLSSRLPRVAECADRFPALELPIQRHQQVIEGRAETEAAATTAFSPVHCSSLLQRRRHARSVSPARTATKEEPRSASRERPSSATRDG